MKLKCCPSIGFLNLFLFIDSFIHLATCPECRKGINVKKEIIPRLFFNQADFDPGEIDPGKLKNDLDSVKLDLRQKEREKDELRKECRSKEVSTKYLRVTYASDLDMARTHATEPRLCKFLCHREPSLA